MKRKQKEYQQAIVLRKQGKGIKIIAKSLGVSVSIVSEWCRDVPLTKEQIKRLRSRKVQKVHLRRLAKLKHRSHLLKVKGLLLESENEIAKLKDHELFIAGLALYWGEGFKSIKEGRVGFCNSDPRMIKFIINWFEKALKVKREDFVLRAEFNSSHGDRTQEIQDYWSNLTGISSSQFNKPFYHHSIWLREYADRNKYFGVLRIRVRKSSELLTKMQGWIKGLSNSA